MKKLLVLFPLLLSLSVSAQHVGALKSVTAKTIDNKHYVFITGEGTLDYNTLSMDNPPRIVIDFSRVKNLVYPSTMEVKENPFVQRVRTSIYARGPDVVSRVVVDLTIPCDYSVTRVKDGVALAFSQAAPAPAPATPPKTTGPTVPVSSTSPAPKPVETLAAPQQLLAPDIVIGPEDLIEVSVFELPQFNVTARVQGDGTITMPLIGSIEVRGLKKKDVESKISSALQAKYVNNASVSVNVKEYKSRQVTVLGAVKIPGPYYLLSQRTLLQLLSETGGLLPNAGNKCFIFRPGSPKIEINLAELMNTGNLDLNVPIYPGDVVNIPVEEKIFIYVFGAVRTPGAVEMSASQPMTFLSVMARAGGPTESAGKGNISIKRKNAAGEETIIKVNMKDILKGKAEDPAILPGDVIIVPESFF